MDATRLGLTVRVVTRHAGSLDLEFQIDPRNITLQPQNGTWEGALDLWLVEFGIDDRPLKTVSHLASLRLSPATYERAMQTNGLVLSEHLEMNPGTSLVRVLVRDVASGALGSVSIPLSRLSP